MNSIICADSQLLAGQAAVDGANLIRAAIVRKGHANVAFASGASQMEMLTRLVRAAGIDWGAVNAFHLDEFIGVDEEHPGSSWAFFRRSLLPYLPAPLRHFHRINPGAEPQRECARLSAIISDHPLDVAFIGIGASGRLAANDPPADFATTQPYIIVVLNEACRQEQVDAGWFHSLDEVPTMAMTMSVSHILRSRAIVGSVPAQRKADAVKAVLEGPLSPAVPASALRSHPNATLYLDQESASRLLAVHAPCESGMAELVAGMEAR